MSVEIQKKQCKVCSEFDTRIALGKYPDSRNKKWVNTDGKAWNGLVCPGCHKKRAAAYIQAKRNNSVKVYHE